MSTLTIEDPAYFERLAEVERRHWWSVGMWRLAEAWLTAALQGRRGLRALDVGCGTGETAVRLGAIPAIDRVVGLDPSPEAVARSRGRHDYPLVQGTATALPFREGSFDVIACFDVLQHLGQDGEILGLGEIARVLTPGGFAIIRANGRGLSGKRQAYRIGQLTDLAVAAGLQVRRSSYANCLPSLAQEVRGHLSPLLGRWKPSHPEGGGLRIALPDPRWNRLMSCVATAEVIASGRLGLPLPFGHSTLLLVQRPDRPLG